MRSFSGVDELVALRGQVLGTGDWAGIGQERIDRFAEATGDRQWIHVDTERARDSVYGTTVAHGYLTLSMLPVLLRGIYRVEGVRMAVNYGLGTVRFPAPVPAGTRVRATALLKEVTPLDGAVQVTVTATVEAEGGSKPVCVADSIVRYML